MSKYNYGFATDTRKLDESEYKNAAHDWAEGCTSLEHLLLYCLENGIKTQSCCIGHNANDEAYLQFEFSKGNIETLLRIINRYSNFDGIRMTFFNETDHISKFVLRFSQELREYIFTDMLNLLHKKEKIALDSLDLCMKNVIEVMSKHAVDKRYVEFQYTKSKTNKEIFFATNYTPYCEKFIDAEDKIYWIDNGVGIERATDEMIPIISDVSSKITYEKENKTDNPAKLKQNQQEKNQYRLRSQILFFDSKLAKKDPNLIFIDFVGDIYSSAQKLIDCKNNGKMAFGIFNGIALDNFTYQSADEIVDYFMNSFEQLSNLNDTYEPLTNNELEKLYEIKEARALGKTLSDSSLEFEKRCMGRYENDSYAQILVVLDKYYDLKKDELNKSSESSNFNNEQEIEIEYNDSFRNRSLRVLKVGPADTINDVARKLEILRNQGVPSFAIVDGIEIDNFNELSSEEMAEKYSEKKFKIDRNNDSYSNNVLNILTPEVCNRLSNIENAKSCGHYVSEKDMFFSEHLLENLEYHPDPFSQTMVALNNYSKMIGKKTMNVSENPKAR